jgi:hypothetical protein
MDPLGTNRTRCGLTEARAASGNTRDTPLQGRMGGRVTSGHEVLREKEEGLRQLDYAVHRGEDPESSVGWWNCLA